MPTNETSEELNEAVSPVIATILMVAITVVLAGVLYVWANELASDQTDFGTMNNYAVEDAPGFITGGVNDPLARMSFTSGEDDLQWAFLDVKLMIDERIIPCKVGALPAAQGDVPDLSVEADVSFSVIDEGNQYTAVDISGAFNAWTNTVMSGDGQGTWTITVTLSPGEYAWSASAAGDDLVVLAGLSDNPVVNVADDGSSDGVSSITIPDQSSGTSGSSVTFTVVDDGNGFADVEIKGQFSNWATTDMTDAGSGNWQYTIALEAGSYEWGAVENDGSNYGIWLPGLAGFSSNPTVVIAEDGSVSGDTSFILPTQQGTPVTLTVADMGDQFQDVEIKGEFSSWAQWQMVDEGNGIWAYTISLQAGSYEWGAVENDGSEYGIWLPSLAGFNSNPNLTVNADGSIAGDTGFSVPDQGGTSVTFTVVDDGNSYTDVEIKGEFTNDWETRNMVQNGNTWTYSLSLDSGSYEWGAVHNDGSEWGIWLPALAGFNSNPTVMIAADGTVSGDVTFTVPDQNPTSSGGTDAGGTDSGGGAGSADDSDGGGSDSNSGEFQYAADCIITESGSDTSVWEGSELLMLYEGGDQICSSWKGCEVEISVYYKGKQVAGDRADNQLY